MVDLDVGDFLYQSDQELFLVVIEENDDSFKFAAHGWRDIGKDRVEDYVEDSRSKIHTQEKIERMVDEKGSEDIEEQLNKLKQLFAVYENGDIPDGGLPDSFVLEE